MAALTMTHTSGMRRGTYVIGKKNGGRSTMSRTRWFRTGIQLHYMQERCPGRVYLIKGLCEMLNGGGQISSACIGLVGERMREQQITLIITLSYSLLCSQNNLRVIELLKLLSNRKEFLSLPVITGNYLV